MEITRDTQWSCLDLLSLCYSGVVSKGSRVCHYLNLDSIWDIVAAILTEPMRIMDASVLHSLGNVPAKNFRIFDLNPTDVKTNDIAILLLHGAGSNQGLFFHFAERFNAEKVGPTFTVNIPSVGSCCQYVHEIQDSEIEAAQERIREIKALGIKHIVVVGYSRGAKLGRELAMRDRDIKKVIGIAHPCQDEADSRFYDIVARYDAICPDLSTLGERSQSTFQTGHIGALFEESIHDRVIQVIRSCDKVG